MDIIHDFLNQFKTTFTRPSFHHFARLVTGFAQITGPKAVTEVNDSANWSRHHSTIYDFFRKGKWQHQHITQDLMLWYLRTCKRPEAPLLLCIDDTKNFKPHARVIEKLCWHAEHHKRVRANVKTEDGQELSAFGVVGEKGHCWVTLGVLHEEKTGWCFMPMNASIFVREKHTEVFKTKHDLALELVEQLPYSKDALLVGDNFYGTQNFVNKLKCPVLSLLKSTAVGYRPLTAPMDKTYRGRPKRYGEKVQLATFLDNPERLTPTEVFVYGKNHKLEYACFEGLLKGHTRPVKVILVKGLRKANFLLFTNDLKLTPEQMIAYYGARFQIELGFRELKQELGAFNYRLRSETSVLRYVHLAFVAYALLKFLSVKAIVKPLQTPWYKPKGRASLKRVQQWMRDVFQSSSIFKGVSPNLFPPINTQNHDFITLQGS